MRAHFTFAAACIMVVSALAGCMQDDAPGSTGRGGGGSGSPPKVLTTEEAYAHYETAMLGLEQPTPDTRRFSMVARAEAQNASEPAFVDMRFLADLDLQLMIMTMTAEGLEDEEDGGMMPEGELIVGQVAKTVFFGGEDGILGWYNSSQKPVEDYSDFNPNPVGDEDDDGFNGPQAFMDYAKAASKDGLVESKPTTHNGRHAVELTFRAEDPEDGASRVRAIVLLEPAVPVLVEAHYSNPGAEDALSRDGVVKMEFFYGADATHPLEAGLLRLETMAFYSSEDMEGAFSGFGGGGSDSTTKTYTIQPSRAPGTVPLAEVEARVFGGMGSEDKGPALLTLPLEKGSAENADVKVTFTDKDGNGKVSPGDTLTLSKKSDAAQGYVVMLYDEKTGLHLAPGLGLPALVALLGLAAVAFRRR